MPIIEGNLRTLGEALVEAYVAGMGVDHASMTEEAIKRWDVASTIIIGRILDKRRIVLLLQREFPELSFLATITYKDSDEIRKVTRKILIDLRDAQHSAKT